MRSALAVMLLTSQLSAVPASAGAWLREKGTSFVASTFSATYYYDLTQSTYLEYGLREDLTLGADVTTFQNPFGLQTGSATLFLRFPLGEPTEQGRWAYELGAGASWVGEMVSPHLKAGLSWGRGYTLQNRNGWLAVDASVKWEFGFNQGVIKLDTTAGLDFTEVTSGMVQLFVSHTSAGTFAKVAPSVIFSPRGTQYRVQIGSEVPANAPENTAIKIGIWRQF